MLNFDVETLLAEMGQVDGQNWREFLRVPSLSMGVYRLRAGEADRQTPHTEDEVYYVVGGHATFRAGARACEARAGTVLFVEKSVEHRFTDVREDLTVLVFFAPAEHSAAQRRDGKARPDSRFRSEAALLF